MSKLLHLVPLAVIGTLLSGCGGGNSALGPQSGAGGAALSEFEAPLPDGSSMVIEILENDQVGWAGEFVVVADSGEHAYETGSFEGSVVGNSLHAVCETSTGQEFELEGTANSDRSMDLTRSDFPGAKLHFTPVQLNEAASRSEASFALNTGAMNGRATISTTPVSTHVSGDTTIREYRGTWNGVPLTFWSYNSGYASIITYLDPLCVNSASFSSYTLADIPTATKSSSASTLSMYNTSIRAQLKFRTSVTVSP